MSGGVQCIVVALWFALIRTARIGLLYKACFLVCGCVWFVGPVTALLACTCACRAMRCMRVNNSHLAGATEVRANAASHGMSLLQCNRNSGHGCKKGSFLKSKVACTPIPSRALLSCLLPAAAAAEKRRACFSMPLSCQRHTSPLSSVR